MSAHNELEQQFDAEYEMADPGNGQAIRVSKNNQVVSIRTTAAETRTLPNPTKVGVALTLAMVVDGGNCVVTAATAINVTGNTVMTFADANDTITLRSIRNGASGFRWSVQGNDGVALS